MWDEKKIPELSSLLFLSSKENKQKSNKLYEYIDASDFYSNPIAKDCRSLMNVPFTLAKSELDERFLNEAKSIGLLNLKGHRSGGGMRASIYNAMPLEGVETLIDFMETFSRQNSVQM